MMKNKSVSPPSRERKGRKTINPILWAVASAAVIVGGVLYLTSRDGGKTTPLESAPSSTSTAEPGTVSTHTVPQGGQSGQSEPLAANPDSAVFVGRTPNPIGLQIPEMNLFGPDGTAFQFQEQRGKVILLSYFRLSDEACKRQIPDFTALQDKYGDKGFEIVCIALDDAQDVSTFLQEQPLNFRLLIGNEGVKDMIVKVEKVPTTFLLNREHIVQFMATGVKPKAFWEKHIEKFLR
ncbi:MAG: TlpA disulfide reductase family protein [Bacteroidota bacterium]|nr:TlpA disulfide reductase family protein [Bacteroidota bacterium]